MTFKLLVLCKCAKFQERFLSYTANTIFKLKIIKAQISVKNLGQVMVCNLCSSSDANMSKDFGVIELNDFHTEICKRDKGY